MNYIRKNHKMNLIVPVFLMMFSIGLFAQNYLSGQIIVDPNRPQWLKYHGGGPFFMCGPGDPEGFLYRGNRNPDGTRNGDQLTLINKLVGTNANCIYLMAIRSHGGDGELDENPFINSDPIQGLDYDILDQWETWFTAMDENEIVIYFFFYDDNASIWNTGDVVESDEKNFIHTIVNYFEHHKHLIWCVAEEYEEKFSPSRASKIAGEIKAADDYEHVVAIHKLEGIDFSEFASDPNVDQFAIQFDAESPEGYHQGMLNAWGDANGRYNLNFSEGHPDIFGADARKRAWAVAMGGAYVMHLGWDIQRNSITELQDCGRLRKFFELTNFNKMAPHDQLKFGATKYVLAFPDSSYILYTDFSGKIGIQNIDEGLYNFLWFDPVDGDQEVVTNVHLSEGDNLFTRPTKIGDEVALFLSRGNIPVSVLDNSSSSIQDNFRLQQNYPNPFNPVTYIKFFLKESTQVSLSVYDTLGREVDTIYNNDWLPGGDYEVSFNGSQLESGIYFYHFDTKFASESRKMVLLR